MSRTGTHRFRGEHKTHILFTTSLLTFSKSAFAFRLSYSRSGNLIVKREEMCIAVTLDRKDRSGKSVSS